MNKKEEKALKEKVKNEQKQKDLLALEVLKKAEKELKKSSQN